MYLAEGRYFDNDEQMDKFNPTVDIRQVWASCTQQFVYSGAAV